MAIDTSLWAADLQLIINDMPSVATFEDGSTVTGTASHVTKTGQNALEGVYPDYDVEWVGLLSAFSDSTLYSVRKRVTIGGQTYFVQERIVGQVGVKLRLSLR